MDQISNYGNQLPAAIRYWNQPQNQAPNPTTITVQGVDVQGEPRALTTCPAPSSPASPTSAPVLTSASAPGIVSTQPGNGVAQTDGPTEQSIGTEMVCHDRSGFSNALAALERGNCSATELAITPYALNDEEMKRLAKAVSVVGNRIADIKLVTTGLGKEGFIALADLINENSGLHTVGLTDFRGDEQRPWQSLADALAQNRTLKSLTILFSGTSYGGLARRSINEALSSNEGLRKVELSSSVMDGKTSVLLARSLRANPRIESLTLDGLSFHPECKHTGLMKTIASHPGLTQVSLGASLSQDDLHHLMLGLAHNKVLKKLSVDFSNLGGKTHDAVFANGAHSMLADNDTLQELRIRNHMLTDAGVWVLSNVLKTNRALQKLDLSPTIRAPGPAITETSARHLSNMLNDNKVVQQINIDFYAVCEDGNWGLAGDCHPVKQELRDKLAKNHAQ